MAKEIGIYSITSPTGKLYVGQSWDLDGREEDYLRGRCKGQTKLYNSIKKHGWSNHIFKKELELRYDISQSTLDCWEEYFYELYKSQGLELLNLKYPGSHGKHSEESKRKMSESLKGKFKGDKNPMYGRKRTDAEKAKVSAANKGHNRNGKKVYQFSKDGVLIRSWGSAAEAARSLGVKPPQISACVLGKYNTAFRYLWKSENTPVEPYNGQRRTNILIEQLTLSGEFIREWDSQEEASKELGISQSTISMACNNVRRITTAGGYKWRFKKQNICE